MMLQLEDNVFNRGRRQDESKFKLWKSAGLMLSYGCPCRCACCYVYSGPQAGSVDTEMSVPMALGCWKAVRRLAGEEGLVHITGGEPFDDFERLEEILRTAQAEGLEGLEKIETNANWCTNENLVRDRLGRLCDLGLSMLQISTDVYHQEYVPMERVCIGVQIGREVLGADRVQIRWRDFYQDPVLVGPMSREDRGSFFLRAMNHRRERLLGRAAEELSDLLPARVYEDFAGQNCKKNLLGAQHVHIDGSGNVFSGTCIGIMVGKVKAGPEGGLDELWQGFDYREHPIISVLVDQGPVGLIKSAIKAGYKPKRGYG
ncbi:MAG: radical SAM protein, partial [Planctomycetes bacterium]|nr:radical SAM protein [Planctomycetota bacterium]